jgi:hypothetical protein
MVDKVCAKCGKPATAYCCEVSYEDWTKEENRTYLCEEHADAETDYIVFHLPPTCPKCGKLMDELHIERAEGLVWNEERGRYDDNGQGSGSCACKECNEVIGTYTGDGQSDGFWPEDE